MLFNLDFARDAILSRFFFFFLTIDLYFLVPAIVAEILNAIAELVIPLGIPIKEVKTEVQINPVIV